jgi:cytochrome c-type biogenesis protein CcmH
LVTTTFSLLAALMLAAALAFVLLPLLRVRGGAEASKRRAIEQARRAGVMSEKEARAKLAELAPARGPTSRVVPATVALLIPLLAILLYRTVGEPRALDPVWRDAVAATSPQAAGTTDVPDMQQAVAGLAERMKNEPDDLEGWMLLGRAYKTMERFEPAREALANAYRLAPENPDVLVEYAEAQVLASESRRFQGEALELLTRAVELQPDSQRGLWLLGIAAYQAGNYAQSVQVWERLLASLPADAEPRAALEERIADARGRIAGDSTGSPRTGEAGLASTQPAATARGEPVEPPSTAGPGPARGEPVEPPPSASPGPARGEPVEPHSTTPRLTVTVDIAPELKSKIGASDVLFVFARAAQGPRMPLAIQRLPAAQLPVTVTLDDSTSMMPAMKLSTIPQVVVGARISKSGQATPQPGDLETFSTPLANTHAEPIVLTIDRVVP